MTAPRTPRLNAESPDPQTHLGFAVDDVAEDYVTWGERSMYGKTYWGVQRATFIVDREGTIAHVIPKASPKTHDDEVLAALSAIA